MKQENRGGIFRPRLSIEDGESIHLYCAIKNVRAHRSKTIYFIAVSTMSISCSVVPPLTPTPATTSPSLARGTPPPIAE